MPRPSSAGLAARRLLLVGYGQPGRQWQSACGRARGYYHWEWIECQCRAIAVADQEVRVLFDSPRPRPVRVPRSPAGEQGILDEFLESLESGEAPHLGAEDNLLSVASLAAAVRSAGLGRPVTLSEVGNAAGVPLAAQAVAHG